MTSEQLAELMEKYRAGTCTPEEAAILDQWYSSYESKPNVLDPFSAVDRDALQQRMYGRITNRIYLNNMQQRNGVIISLWAKIAVAAVLTGLVVFFAWDKQTVDNKSVAAANSWASVINNSNNILKHTLADGSNVWLKPGASLQYPKTFKPTLRNVTMQGECFFEVTKNPKQPFIIVSRHIVTKVWGTSFRVSDADNAEKATVTVMTGKVSVSKTGSDAHKAGVKLLSTEVMLLPSQQVTYNSTQNELKTDRNADMSSMDLWKHIDLSFNDQKLTAIAVVLSKRFGVDIKIEGEGLKKASMTADLTGLNLPELLEVLKTSMNINYQISNDQITLKRTN